MTKAPNSKPDAQNLIQEANDFKKYFHQCLKNQDSLGH
jgi:hypothetical protein